MAAFKTGFLSFVMTFLVGSVHFIKGDVPPYYSTESRLKTALLNNYDKTVPPITTVDIGVNVDIRLAIISIHNLDEKTGVLSTHVWLRKNWIDKRLSWNKSDYNITNVAIPHTQMWIPDIVPYNSASDQFRYSSDYHVVVSADGSVLFVPHVLLHTTCPVDLRDFPFDTQHCSIKLGSWVYDGLKVNLTANTLDPDTSFMQQSPTWELVEATGKRSVIKYDCCPEPYIDVTVTLKLKRRSHMIMNLFVAPTVCFSLLLPFLFLLPSNCGGKLVLGSGLLISQTVILQMLIDMIPYSHTQLPTLASYFLTNVVLVCLSLAFSALVLNMAERAKKSGCGVPALVDRIFLGPLSLLVCIRREDYIEDQDSAKNVSGNGADVGSTFDDRATMVAQYSRLVAPAEWRQLAAVIDRLLLGCFLLAAIIVTIMLLALGGK